MLVLTRLLNRVLPALVLGLGVMLISAGLLGFAPAGLNDVPSPTSEPPLVAGDPLFSAPPDASDDPSVEPGSTAGPDATPGAGPTQAPGATPPAEGTPGPGVTPGPGATPSDPQASPVGPQPTTSATEPPAGPTTWPVLPTPTPKPGASPPPATKPPPGGGGVASRIRIASLRIDLPILSGDIKVRGNRGGYPLCDVAQYLTFFVQPGEPGATYIYAHAQRGMFLPMLRASRINDGASMIGALVEVYTSQNKRFLYEIHRVKRHATNLNIAINVPAGQHMLVMQTSEGPSGTPGKLQVAARLVSVSSVSAAQAQPTPHPRVCLPR